jgi:hypothetical protein
MRFQSKIGRPNAGWIQFRFTGNGGEIDVLASAIPNDPFYELVTAVQAAFEYGGSHDVRMHEEPQWSILTFEKDGDTLVVSWRLEKGAQRVRISAPFGSACRDIAQNLDDIVRQLGTDGFSRAWYHPPPSDRIEELRMQTRRANS